MRLKNSINFDTLKNNWQLLFLLFVAFVMRFYHLDFQSLWIDEINTMFESDPELSFFETYTTIKNNDCQPPLYFYILKYCFKLFGYTPYVLRSFSATLGVLSIYAIYLLGKEIHSKNVGLIAALILSVNYSHIYYSQEARPYTFLILFSCLSFWALVKFIKHPNYKSAIIYAIYTSLMLYAQLYALFLFTSQIILMVYVFINLPKSNQKNFFILCLLIAVIVLLLFIPIFPTLFALKDVKSSWIQAPTLDIFTSIFKEFFGNAEIVIVLMCLFFVLLFSKLVQSKAAASNTGNIFNSEFSAFFLIIWIVVSMIIPLIRSYLVVPMLVPRYLLGVLPALIIMASIGLSILHSKLLKVTLILIFISFSLTDILIIKNYYWEQTKWDMRGLAKYVSENKNPNDKVVSRLYQHYSFLLREYKDLRYSLETMDSYTNKLMLDSTLFESFWYLDAGDKIDEATNERLQFLNTNFKITKEIYLVGAFARYYSPKRKNSLEINLKDFVPNKLDNMSQIAFFWRDSVYSKPIRLTKGNYTFYVGGISTPDKPINNENAHITVKINGKTIGNGIYLNENNMRTISGLDYEVLNDSEIIIELLFDNDYTENGLDRNAYIKKVYIERKENFEKE